MAEENLIQTNIVATSNMTPLISDLNKVSSSLTLLQERLTATNKSLATQAAVMNKAFSETLRSTGQFSTHFVSLASDVDKFGQQLDRGQLKLGQFFRVYGDHAKTSGGIIRDLAKQQVQLQNAILQPLGRNAEGLMQYNVQIPRGLDLVKNKAAIARQELMIMNKVVQEGANQLINWGKNTQWAGRQLTVGLTVPMMAFGKAASDAFKQADEQLVRLTKVYGGLSGSTSAELQKVRKDVAATAAELSKSYGSSFKDTIGLAADIAATGKQGNELLGSVRETTRLSVLGEIERQDAMKATLAIQTAFKQNTEELTGSINFLNAVENQTSTTLNDLVEAIPKAGPVVKGLGGSIQDLALYLTAMKEGGINAAEGANALKSGLASLINPTNVATEKFKSMGIDLKTIVTANAGNLTATILDLQSALETLNPLQKQQALEQLFGKFQFARMNALFANLGKQGSQTLQVLDLMKASSQDLANIAGRELSQVTESASGKYRRAVEGLKADLAGIGEQFLKINTTLINVVDAVVKFTQKLPDPIKQALGFMGGLTALAGPLIMLTGVLGNFFGYIIKGVYHFKALFKGAHGWKLLTPEILAANKASALIENTFYSDARAAAILKQSLDGLISSYATLSDKVNTAGVPVNPGISTMAGTTIMAGREVNPSSKYLSAKDTRSFSHLEPVSKMSSTRRTNQTIFGVVPGAPLVNQKISDNPQMYMNKDLDRLEGLSSIKGVSTGIVAEEAAKWHSMTAALAMQSKAEIVKLKSEVAATGLVTDEVSVAYQALLPEMTKLTANAAQESAKIVAELKAGKLTVDQARAKILTLNAEIEAMMVQTATQTAAGLGRTLDVTKVPLLNQPVVDPKTGKTNMKELAKPGRTRTLLNSIARSLGVKTYGAPYSIETTMPKRLNQGNIVPGTGNQDTVPAMLTPGEFVVNARATAENLPLLQAINGGMGSSGLGKNIGGIAKPLRLQRTHITDDLSGLSLLLPSWLNMGVNANGSGLTGKQIVSGIQETLNAGYDPNDLMNHAAVTLGGDKSQASRRNTAALNELMNVLQSQEYADKMIGGKDDPFGFERLAKGIYRPALRGIKIDSAKSGGSRNLYSAISQIFTKRSSATLTRDEAISRKLIKGEMTGSTEKGQMLQRRTGRLTWVGQNRTIGSSMPNWARGTNLATLLTTSSGVSHALKILKRNKGGIIPGYALGGRVQAFTKGMIMKKLGAGWGKNDDNPGWSHKSAQIGMGKKLFGNTGLRPYTQNLLYDALLETTANTMPNGYYKTPDGKLLRGIEPNQTDEMLRDAAEIVARRYANQLSPIDKKILKEQFRDMNLKSIKYAPGVQKKIFGFNKGGLVPGAGVQSLNRGGMVRGYAGGGLVANMLLGTLGSMGGQALGQRVAGDAGGMAGNMLGFMLPSMLMGGMGGGPSAGQRLGTSADPIGGMRKSVFANTRFAESLGTAATSGGKLTSTLSKMAIGVTRLNLGVAAVTTAVILGYKAWQKHREEVALNQASYGLTAQSAAKLKVSFTDYNAKIKETIENTKAMIENNRLLFESMASAGTPFKMTIEQYKAMKKEVKATMQEQIKMINNAKDGDVGDLAVRMKEQFVAAGMSAEEASKKIYIAFNLSKKSGISSLSTIGNQDFSKITNAQTAMQSAFKTFAKASASEDAVSQANALNTALTSMDAALKEIVSESEKKAKLDKTGKTQAISGYTAEKVLLDQIKSKVKNQVVISKDLRKELEKHNPEIKKFINSQDTTVSLWQKMRIAAAGYTGELYKLNAAAADALYTMTQEISTSTIAANKAKGGALYSQYQNLAKLLELQKKYSSAAKGQSAMDEAAAKKRIDFLDKEIQKINEAADARKKALQEQADDEDTLLQIRKAQIQYQEALASGDMATAAQLQIDIQRLSNEQQRTLAERAIDERRAKDIAPLQAEKDRINAAQEALATASAMAAESLDKINSKIKDQQDKINNLNNAMIAYKIAIETGVKDMSGFSAALITAANAAGVNTTPLVAGGPPDIVGQQPRPATPQESAKDLFERLGGNKIQASTIYITAEKVFNNETTGTFSKPINAGTTVNKLGISGINWGDKYDPSSHRQQVKKFAKEQGYEAGTQFTLTNADGSKNQFLVLKDGNIQLQKTIKKAEGGLIQGPGTGTSDSIYAKMRYANGGGIYVSNGEHITRASSVASIGVGNMDLINRFGTDGLVKAASNVMGAKFDIPSNSLLSTAGGQTNGAHLNFAPVFQINAAPGMDEELIGMSAAKHALDMFNKQTRDMNAKSGNRGRTI